MHFSKFSITSPHILYQYLPSFNSVKYLYNFLKVKCYNQSTISNRGLLMKLFDHAPGINYSGYREGQSPMTGIYPSKEEIYEDLLILENKYYYLRLFDCSLHAIRTLEVIKENQMHFKVLLGLSLKAEENHVNHPFFWLHSDEDLEKNKIENVSLVKDMIKLSNKYEDIVSAISIGNEVRSIWNNQRVSIEKLIEVTKQLQHETHKPVTFCEEYQTWLDELAPLADVVDFISLHSYPAWQGFNVDKGLTILEFNYQQVQTRFPNKYLVITETGWPTSSHGSRIRKEYATIANQHQYINDLEKWSKENDILVYMFEAFDEPWKGGEHDDEPEKHWGLYDVNRVKKYFT